MIFLCKFSFCWNLKTKYTKVFEKGNVAEKDNVWPKGAKRWQAGLQTKPSSIYQYEY